MALWTPYFPDAPLDLTKASIVKRESYTSESDTSSNSEFGYTQYRGALEHPNHPIMFRPFYPQYPYPPPIYTVGATPVSPFSESSASGSGSLPRLTPPETPPRVTEQRPSSLVRTSSEAVVDPGALSDDPDFRTFEANAMRAMAEKNGGQLLGNNPRMRRAVRSTNENAIDDSYRRQRDRNNYAAKQSRDRRKLREIHLSLKAAYLKQQLDKMKALLAARTCTRCQNRL